MEKTATAPSLCFVIPYFGKWPFWMPFFLASCRVNSTVDWLLFSDCGDLPDCPPNVRVVETNYTDYCERVSACLGMDFHPVNPYKLCDLKPMLGYIHQAELAGYDFWAFGDIDLVWGDLRAYFTSEKLVAKDLLSTHARRISGHCCLIRNTVEMCELFGRMPNWETRLLDNVHHALDESAFSRIFIRHKNWPRALADFAGRFNRWRRRAEFVEAFSTPHAKVPWVDGSFNFPARWLWDHGRLLNDRDGTRCFPYFHFVVWKKHAWRELMPPAQSALRELAASGRWAVDEHGFHPAATWPLAIEEKR